MSRRVDADGRKATPAKREDAIGAIVVLAVAAVILIGGLGIADSSYANAVLSPRDFPWLIGLLMAGAGAVLLVRNASALLPDHGRLKTTKETAVATDSDASATVPPEPADAPADALAATLRPRQDPRILGLLLVLLLGYIVVYVSMGFVLSTFLFLACAAMLLAPKKPVRNLIYAAGLSVSVYLLFNVGLNVLLPAGLLDGLL